MGAGRAARGPRRPTQGALPEITEYRSASMLLPHRRWGSGQESLTDRSFLIEGHNSGIGTKRIGDVCV